MHREEIYFLGIIALNDVTLQIYLRGESILNLGISAKSTYLHITEENFIIYSWKEK